MNRVALLVVSQVVLWAMSATLTACAFKAANPAYPAPMLLALSAAGYALAAALAPIVAPLADEAAQAMARLRAGGILFLFYGLLLVLYLFAMTTGKSDSLLAYVRMACAIQAIHLMLGSDERRQGRTLLSSLALAAAGALAGGTEALVSVAVFAAGYPVVMILLNHSVRWQIYRARGNASTSMVAGLCAAYLIVMLAATLGAFKLAPNPRPAEKRVIHVEPKPPSTWAVDAVKTVLVLGLSVAAVALLVRWGRSLRRSGKKPAEANVSDAAPVRIEPIAPAYAPPPITGGPRRQIIARFVRMLAARGRRRPDVTAREFVPPDPGWQEALSIFSGARYGVSNDVGEPEAARLAELEPTLSRQK